MAEPYLTRDDQVHIDGRIEGLEPNTEHGMHIHVNGDCSAPDASSAGGHFVPLGHPHGVPGTASHVGDLGNIRADAKGVAQIDLTVAQGSLGTKSAPNAFNRAIVVQAGPDHFSTQPDGSSGTVWHAELSGRIRPPRLVKMYPGYMEQLEGDNPGPALSSTGGGIRS